MLSRMALLAAIVGVSGSAVELGFAVVLRNLPAC